MGNNGKMFFFYYLCDMMEVMRVLLCYVGSRREMFFCCFLWGLLVKWFVLGSYRIWLYLVFFVVRVWGLYFDRNVVFWYGVCILGIFYKVFWMKIFEMVLGWCRGRWIGWGVCIFLLWCMFCRGWRLGFNLC